MISIHNPKEDEIILVEVRIAPGSEYIIPELEIPKWAINSEVGIAILQELVQVKVNNIIIADPELALDTLKGLTTKSVEVKELPPFAKPEFRTKYNAINEVTTINPSENITIDLLLQEERYASGGCLIIEGAKFGDWVEAQVVDSLGIIPQELRAIMCEEYPVVVQYVDKQWIKVNSAGITIHELDTSPLNAKIPAGLCLRIIYHSSSEVGVRKIAINYYLTKYIGS